VKLTDCPPLLTPSQRPRKPQLASKNSCITLSYTSCEGESVAKGIYNMSVASGDVGLGALAQAAEAMEGATDGGIISADEGVTISTGWWRALKVDVRL
jgi:hypothetical protein